MCNLAQDVFVIYVLKMSQIFGEKCPKNLFGPRIVYSATGRGVEFYDEDVCLSTPTCLELQVKTSPNLLFILPIAMALCSSGNVAMS